jgi:hypothetical protein
MWLNSVKIAESVSCLQNLYSLEPVSRVLDLRKAHTVQHNKGKCNDPCLKARIIAAVKNIDAPVLKRVWQELEYHIDVCRVTRGAYIEHL